MAFTAMIERARLSDLIVTDYDPSTGYTHDDINVTPPAASAPVTLGTVVFRAKSTNMCSTPVCSTGGNNADC